MAISESQVEGMGSFANNIDVQDLKTQAARLNEQIGLYSEGLEEAKGKLKQLMGHFEGAIDTRFPSALMTSIDTCTRFQTKVTETFTHLYNYMQQYLDSVTENTTTATVSTEQINSDMQAINETIANL